MKRIFSLFLAFTILFALCACQGNFGSVNLQDAISIPDNGIIKASTLRQIKSENAIGIFTGVSNGLSYEWTIFGSDVKDAKDVNLQVTITKDAGAVRVNLSQPESFGTNFLLSIHLDEKWKEISATAYYQQQPFSSASVTGSKTTILNISLDGSVNEFVILADQLPPEESTPSNGTQPSQGKDQYLTDPIPEGKPKPVEPENQEVNTGKTLKCTFFIECSTILNNLDMLDPEKLEMVPSDGVILAKTTVTFYEGESVFDVLQRVCKEYGIHMESSWTPIYNSAYIEGIHNLYEFDCGALSGWMYQVNGWYPNYGCSRYQLQDGDTVQWRYTCDLGEDVGRGMG
jgi:hypothetical protein